MSAVQLRIVSGKLTVRGSLTGARPSQLATSADKALRRPPGGRW